MSLDRHRVCIQCPRCDFYARPFLRQARNQETIICGGCKANILPASPADPAPPALPPS